MFNESLTILEVLQAFPSWDDASQQEALDAHPELASVVAGFVKSVDEKKAAKAEALRENVISILLGSFDASTVVSVGEYLDNSGSKSYSLKMDSEGNFVPNGAAPATLQVSVRRYVNKGDTDDS